MPWNPGWRDADHRHGMVVDAHRAADHGRVGGEAARPEAVAEHHHRMAAGHLVVVAREQPAERPGGRRASRSTCRRRDRPATSSVCPPAPRWMEAPVLGEHAREHAVAVAQTLEHRVGHRREGVGVAGRPCRRRAPGRRAATSRSGSCTGRSRTSTWSISEKIAVLAPMPRASVSTTTAVKPGFLTKLRRAWRRSRLKSSIVLQPPRARSARASPRQRRAQVRRACQRDSASNPAGTSELRGTATVQRASDSEHRESRNRTATGAAPRPSRAIRKVLSAASARGSPARRAWARSTAPSRPRTPPSSPPPRGSARPSGCGSRGRACSS